MTACSRFSRFAAVAFLLYGGLCGPSAALDVRDMQRLVFLGDRDAKFIDVIDPASRERVMRVETEHAIHDLIVTPYAPLVIYANRDMRALYVYNLAAGQWLEPIALPIAPRHAVLDTTGTRIGVTDSEAGGFTLVSAYSQKVLFTLPDVPPTGDVLFDPNDIDVFYTDNASGSLGVIDMNEKRAVELPLADVGAADLSSPSRSLDSRYLYVANRSTGEVYGLNAYSRVIYKTFRPGSMPARPYTTPEGSFLYVIDEQSGRFAAYDQHVFDEFAQVELDAGTDLVAVGRFDRMNLLASTRTRGYSLYDNVKKAVVARGSFRGTPLDVQGAANGKTAYVAFRDRAEVALVELETGAVTYVPATDNGAGTFAVGLSNNVCH